MIPDRKGKSEIPVFTFLNQPPGTCLLQGHSYSAMKIGISRSINRGNIIKNLSCKIESPNLFQFLYLVLCHGFIKLIRSFWDDWTFRPLGRWFQIIGAIGTHLMEVNMDVGIPLVEELQPLTTLYLRGAKPVPI